MCEQCGKVDIKIAYYKRLLASVDDQTASALLDLVIADLEADKGRLHPKAK